MSEAAKKNQESVQQGTEKSQAKLEEIEALLRATVKDNAEIQKDLKYIKKYVRWQQIWLIFRLCLIVVPLILGFIYLPPLIKDALQEYKSVLN